MNLEENINQFDVTLVILSKKYFFGFFNQFAYISWEDVAQDLRLRICQQYEHYDPKRNFNNWAYVICVNHLKNQIKAHHRLKRGYGKSFNSGFEVEFNLRTVCDIFGDKVDPRGPQYIN